MAKYMSEERKKELMRKSNMFVPPYADKEEIVELPGLALSEGTYSGFGSKLMSGAFSASSEEVYESFDDADDAEVAEGADESEVD